ncbi:hypothetical protein IEN91_05290 [Bacillus velezensis]|uniref:hypothetical protein n=1 Tax=Bacillus velezensis TaxID=492670 RepID=UPI0018C7AAA1|nr:hypothetical protein [Bacillus velezensis]QPK89853.1 hypothetical protein IEN91_05290 [Bacillus velezensis]
MNEIKIQKLTDLSKLGKMLNHSVMKLRGKTFMIPAKELWGFEDGEIVECKIYSVNLMDDYVHISHSKGFQNLKLDVLEKYITYSKYNIKEGDLFRIWNTAYQLENINAFGICKLKNVIEKGRDYVLLGKEEIYMNLDQLEDQERWT